jgi:CBS domain-containing protein
MLVREVMTSPAVTVGPREPVRDAIALLDRYRITSIPVVDDAGRPVGVVSEADLLRTTFGRDRRLHTDSVAPGDHGPCETVGEVMTSPARSVSADSDLIDAFDLMDDTVVKSLPVLLNGRVAGVVSRRDIVAALARGELAAARTPLEP